MAHSQRKRETASVPAIGLSIWDVLREAVSPVLQERPSGSITAEEFSEKFGYSASHSFKKLSELVASGKLRKVEYLTSNRKRASCFVKV